jgi:hypothetical protein
VVVEMNLLVGDDDVRVEKSLKKNERPPREEREKPLRSVGKRVRVRLTISFIFW